MDLRATSVHVVEVVWSPSGDIQVTKRGKAPLPAHAWNDLKANTGAIASALRSALSTAGIAAKSATVCLPRRFATLRFARLPKASPEQMQGMVAFEAQQYILFPMEEVVLDYCTLPDDGDEELQTVLLAAVRRPLIMDLLAILERAGLEAEHLTVSGLALAENIRNAIEPTAIVDIEGGELDIVVVANQRLLFTRAASLESANRDGGELRVAEEIARSCAAYQNEYRHILLARILITGENETQLAGVESALREGFETPVERLRGRGYEVGGYATEIGAALQTQPDSLCSINLLPREREEHRAQTAQKRKSLLAVAVIVVAMFASVYFFTLRMQAQDKQSLTQKRANDQMNAALEQLEKSKRAFEKTQALDADLVASLDRTHPAVDVLTALGAALPKSSETWLTQFSFERGGVLTLRGESKSETAATDLALALQRSGSFSEVQLTYLGDSQTNVPQTSSAPNVAATGILPAPKGIPAPPPNTPPNTSPSKPANAVGSKPPMMPPPNGARPPNMPPPAMSANAPKSNAPPVVLNAVPIIKPPAPVVPVLVAPRTAFVIVCKVNAKAKDLIPPDMEKLVTASATKPAPQKGQPNAH